MGDRRVNRDYQVQAAHQGGRVGEILQLLGHVQHGQTVRMIGELFAARTSLQAHETNPGNASQGREGEQGHGTLPITFVLAIALPGNTDFQTLEAAQSLLPAGSQFGVSRQIRDLRRYCGQGCAKDPRQAQQRCLDVKFGWVGAFGHEMVDPSTGAQQA